MTARAARSEAERAERGAGQMRPCTPLTSASTPRESAFKPVPHPAAPVGQSSQTRRHHLTPTPVQQLCTPVQSCGQKRSFLLDRARPVFFSGKTEKKMGGAFPTAKPCFLAPKIPPTCPVVGTTPCGSREKRVHSVPHSGASYGKAVLPVPEAGTPLALL